MRQRGTVVREGSGFLSGVTHVTTYGVCLWQSNGTVTSIEMQVFTTIFLAETLRANVACVEETADLDQNLPGAVEFKDTLRKRIAMLEARGFFESDKADD